MFNRIIKISFFVVFLFITRLVAAEDLYKVEIIVFRDVSRHDTLSDNLIHQQQLLNSIKLKELTKEVSNSVTNPQPYTELPQSYWNLLPEQATLLNKKGFKILLHIAWIQPITDKKNTIPVHIYGGDTVPLDPKSATDKNLYIPQNLTNPTKGLWELDGIIRISENYSISVNTDFVLSIPSTTNINGVQQYYMNQTQHVQLHELHYFDHPFFGVLTKITPFNFEENTDSDNEDDDD